MNMLQNDLHQMEELSKTWLLQFHPWKCAVMSCGNMVETLLMRIHMSFLSTGFEHVLEEKRPRNNHTLRADFLSHT